MPRSRKSTRTKRSRKRRIREAFDRDVNYRLEGFARVGDDSLVPYLRRLEVEVRENEWPRMSSRRRLERFYARADDIRAAKVMREIAGTDSSQFELRVNGQLIPKDAYDIQLVGPNMIEVGVDQLSLSPADLISVSHLGPGAPGVEIPCTSWGSSVGSFTISLRP